MIIILLVFVSMIDISLLVLLLTYMKISICIYHIPSFKFLFFFLFCFFYFLSPLYVYMYFWWSYFFSFSPLLWDLRFLFPLQLAFYIFLALSQSVAFCDSLSFSSTVLSLSVTLWYYLILYDIWYNLILYMKIWYLWITVISHNALLIIMSISFNNDIFIRMVGLHSCRLPLMVTLILSTYSLLVGLLLKQRLM